ncbi:MAG: glycosyl transferase family 90 [Marinilabiliaceae bacterium]
MNIVLINSIGKHKWGGGEKWMIMAAGGLMDMGHHVVTICRRDSLLARKAREQNIPVEEIGANSDFDIIACFKFCNFFRSFNPDVVIGCQNKDWRVAAVALKMIGSTAKVYSRQGLQLLKNHWWYKCSVKYLCDGIITNTHTIKEAYEKFLPVEKDFIKVIFNGVETINNGVERYDYSKYIPEGVQDPLVVLSTGRLARQKGFKFLIDAAAGIVKKYPNVYFFLAGRGKLEHNLQERIERHGLQNHFILLGFVDEIHSLLKGADIFVFTSLYEGMPNSVLEAMAQGLPVVSTNVNGLSELVSEGYNGYTVEPSNAGQLEEALELLISKADKRLAIGSNAKRVVEKDFSIEQMVSNLSKIIGNGNSGDGKKIKRTAFQFFLNTKFIGKVLSLRHKKIKVFYYAHNFFRQFFPSMFFRQSLNRWLAKIDDYQHEDLLERVNYYNKLQGTVELEGGIKISDFRIGRKLKTYYFDTYEHLRYFSRHLRFIPVFGDVTSVPEQPAFVKSRPVGNKNANSVLLKLNKIRHFNFIKDPFPFENKKDKLVWRGHLSETKDRRVRFVQQHIDHPLCNVGCINFEYPYEELYRQRMTIDEQLEYKFILCIEGNDVASNLKWVMSSNSLAVMPRPRYETWFMEGRLIPDFHYVEIKDDFSDLQNKIEFYSQNPKMAWTIIDNAHQFISQFGDRRKEKLISLLVIDKYFECTGQYGDE